MHIMPLSVDISTISPVPQSKLALLALLRGIILEYRTFPHESQSNNLNSPQPTLLLTSTNTAPNRTTTVPEDNTVN